MEPCPPSPSRTVRHEPDTAIFREPMVDFEDSCFSDATVGADRSLEIPFTLGAGRRRTLLLDPSVDLDLEAALPVENPPRMPSSNFLEDVADGYNTYPLYSWSGDRVLHTLERPPPLLPTPHSDHSYGRSDTSQRPSEEQRTSRSYGARLRSAGSAHHTDDSLSNRLYRAEERFALSTRDIQQEIHSLDRRRREIEAQLRELQRDRLSHAAPARATNPQLVSMEFFPTNGAVSSDPPECYREATVARDRSPSRTPDSPDPLAYYEYSDNLHSPPLPSMDIDSPMSLPSPPSSPFRWRRRGRLSDDDEPLSSRRGVHNGLRDPSTDRSPSPAVRVSRATRFMFPDQLDSISSSERMNVSRERRSASPQAQINRRLQSVWMPERPRPLATRRNAFAVPARSMRSERTSLEQRRSRSRSSTPPVSSRSGTAGILSAPLFSRPPVPRMFHRVAVQPTAETTDSMTEANLILRNRTIARNPTSQRIPNLGPPSPGPVATAVLTFDLLNNSTRKKIMPKVKETMEKIGIATGEERALRALTPDACTVCLEVPEPLTASLSYPCLHTFCEECISKWVQTKSTCPNCQANVTRILFNLRGENDYDVKTVESRNYLNGAPFEPDVFDFIFRFHHAAAVRENIVPSGRHRAQLNTLTASAHTRLPRRSIEPVTERYQVAAVFNREFQAIHRNEEFTLPGVFVRCRVIFRRRLYTTPASAAVSTDPAEIQSDVVDRSGMLDLLQPWLRREVMAAVVSEAANSTREHLYQSILGAFRRRPVTYVYFERMVQSFIREACVAVFWREMVDFLASRVSMGVWDFRPATMARSDLVQPVTEPNVVSDTDSSDSIQFVTSVRRRFPSPPRTPVEVIVISETDSDDNDAASQFTADPANQSTVATNGSVDSDRDRLASSDHYSESSAARAASEEIMTPSGSRGTTASARDAGLSSDLQSLIYERVIDSEDERSFRPLRSSTPYRVREMEVSYGIPPPVPAASAPYSTSRYSDLRLRSRRLLHHLRRDIVSHSDSRNRSRERERASRVRRSRRLLHSSHRDRRPATDRHEVRSDQRTALQERLRAMIRPSRDDRSRRNRSRSRMPHYREETPDRYVRSHDSGSRRRHRHAS